MIRIIRSINNDSSKLYRLLYKTKYTEHLFEVLMKQFTKMDQKQTLQNYEKLHNFFAKTLTFFNFDFFNRSRDFRVRNLFFAVSLLLSYYFNIFNVIKSYREMSRMVWTFNVAWFIVHFMALTRAFTFIYNKKEFFALLEEIGQLYSKNFSGLVLKIQQENLKSNFKLIIWILV